MPATRRSESPASRNELLAALTRADYRRLRPDLAPISLPSGHVLHERGGPVRAVYFPGDGVCSVMQIMKSGRMVEVATVGNEGFIAIPSLFGGGLISGRALVLVPDRAAQVMTAEAFNRERRRGGPFANVINGYLDRFVASLMQSVACNALHSVEQRCARWLLTMRDRAGGDTFPLTQELLAVMLGVRRPTVTLVVGALQRMGVIAYGHKRMAIVDRAGLKAASCECYAAMRRHFPRAAR